MAVQAPHWCAVPGCSVLTVAARCPAHAVALERSRPNVEIRRWYRTKRWKALRARVLADQAYRCADCGYVALALEVDHIVKHGGDPGSFWNRANLQALCSSCHSRKTKRGE